MASPSPILDLPDNLSWLQNTRIGLWIDQEGFRAVFPTFKLSGYTKHDHLSQRSHPPGITGDNLEMVEFLPMKRDCFVFHHATLDPPPMMRRLSVNGDESRDYLSHIAHLNLKSSKGSQMYAVYGTEAKRPSYGDDDANNNNNHSALDSVKLEWLFEYAVEDKRKADGARVGHGEKVLTPLRFCCSPWLVHPRQGRKVTVMQVWKKNVQPRVVADKVDPPKLLMNVPSGSGSTGSSSPSSHSPGFSPKNLKANFKFSNGYKMAIWNMNGSRRPNSSYEVLKENDSWEELTRPLQSRSQHSSWARRRSTSSMREDQEVARSRTSSFASGRSRSMDAQIMEIDGVRQVISSEEFERLILMDEEEERGGASASTRRSPVARSSGIR